MIPRQHSMENGGGGHQVQQDHSYKPLGETQDIPYLQIVTPNQMLRVPQEFQNQYKALLERWANQCIRKSNQPYNQPVPYRYVLVLLEIAKNGNVQEYKDYVQVILDEMNSSGSDKAQQDDEEEEFKNINNSNHSSNHSSNSSKITLKQVLNLKDLEGNTSIHFSIMRMQKSIIGYLIDSGADLDIQNYEEGHTPLHWACIKADSTFVYQLVEGGADIHITDKRGYNALLHAAQYNHIHSVRYLIEKGLSVQSKDSQGHTAVHWAAFQGHTNMARFFITMGVDQNLLDVTGRTALHWACMKGHKSVVTMLCEFDDCQINVHKDTNGNMPIDLAISKGYKEIVDFIESRLRDDRIFGGSVEKYDQFWIIAGIFTILVPTFIICNFPAIFAYPLIGGCGYFIKNYLQLNYWIPERNNWILPTTLYSSVMLWYMAYIMRIAPMVMAVNMVPHLIVNSMAWFFFIFFIKLTKENPGSVANHLTKQQSTQHFMECLSENRQLPLICPTCLINRPIRSKHCPTCKMCIGRFDHHCVWIGNCVGINNQALFITVLFSYVILVVSGFITVKDYFHYDNNAPKIEDGYWNSFKYFYTYHTLILMYAIYGIGMSFWIAKLGLSQVISILVNKTTYEQILQIREFENRQKELQQSSHGHSHGGSNEQCNHSHGGGGSTGAGANQSSESKVDKSFQNQYSDFDMYNRGVINNVKEFLFETKQFYFKFTSQQQIV